MYKTQAGSQCCDRCGVFDGLIKRSRYRFDESTNLLASLDSRWTLFTRTNDIYIYESSVSVSKHSRPELEPLVFVSSFYVK
jgi:hypothetical protein